jgi:hypothetical protein
MEFFKSWCQGQFQLINASQDASTTASAQVARGLLNDHLLLIEDFHVAGELHAPWPGDTLDLVLWGPSDAQLKQQSTKLRRDHW